MKKILLSLLVAALFSGCASLLPNRTYNHYQANYSKAYAAKNAVQLRIMGENKFDEMGLAVQVDLLKAPDFWEVMTASEGGAEAITSDVIITSLWGAAAYYADKEWGVLGHSLSSEEKGDPVAARPPTQINALNGGRITINDTTESFAGGGITADGQGSEVTIDHYVGE